MANKEAKRAAQKKGPSRRVLTGLTLILVLMVGVIGYGEWGAAEVDYVLLYGSVGLFIITAVLLGWNKARYKSKQIIAPGLSDSFGGKESIKENGIWRIVPIGGINLGHGFKTEYPLHGTIITIDWALNHAGNNTMVNAIPQKRQIEEIDPSLWPVLDDYNIRPPVYLAVLPTDGEDINLKKVIQRADLTDDEVEDLKARYSLEDSDMTFLAEKAFSASELANTRSEKIRELQGEITAEHDVAQALKDKTSGLPFTGD